MRYFALWVTRETYPLYKKAAEEAETEIVFDLYEVENQYLVKYVYDGDIPPSTTIYSYKRFHEKFWTIDPHSYTEFFEVTV